MLVPRRLALRRIALAGALLAGCGPGAEPAAPAGPLPRGEVRPPLVASLSPVATRFVLALEAGHLLLGVDAGSAAAVPGLEDLPVVDLAGAIGLAPDLVLVPVAPDPGDPAARELWESGAEVVEFQPHTLEDVAVLCRSVGVRLAGEAGAQRFELDLNLPLAQVGGEASGPRPRVLAVTRLDPPEVAGAHSFETDLIEIAGGTSVTHALDEPRLAIPPERWGELAPDLLLVVSASEPSPAERLRAEAALPRGYRIAFFAFDRDSFWLGDPAADARRLRALIEPVARELAARAPAP